LDEIYVSNVTFPGYYDSRNDKVYMRLVSTSHKRFSHKIYDMPAEVSVGFRNPSVNYIPLSTSNLYYHGFWGIDDAPVRTITDSLCIYSFSYDPNIYVYNRYSGLMEVKGGR